MCIRDRGGSGRATITSPAIMTVRGGKGYVQIEWSSPNYDYMKVENKTFKPLQEAGNSTFELPIIDVYKRQGNIVEILTSNSANHGPSRDWIKIVKTSGARNKIRSWFKKERREENIREGREELEREFRRNSISLTLSLIHIFRKQPLNSWWDVVK